MRQGSLRKALGTPGRVCMLTLIQGHTHTDTHESMQPHMHAVTFTCTYIHTRVQRHPYTQTHFYTHTDICDHRTTRSSAAASGMGGLSLHAPLTACPHRPGILCTLSSSPAQRGPPGVTRPTGSMWELLPWLFKQADTPLSRYGHPTGARCVPQDVRSPCRPTLL